MSNNFGGITRERELCNRAQADNRLRPFLRRFERTRLPPTVDIRERNPWRRLRTNLLGWNVLFNFSLR